MKPRHGNSEWVHFQDYSLGRRSSFVPKCAVVWVDLLPVAMIAIDSENAGCWGSRGEGGDCILPSKGKMVQ